MGWDSLVFSNEIFHSKQDIYLKFSRSRHTQLPTPALQETQENKDGLQPESATEAGACLREESLRCRRGEEAVGASVVIDGNTGKTFNDEALKAVLHDSSLRLSTANAE